MPIILAAGQGTRLRPLTADRPKALLPVAGAPLIEHLFAGRQTDVHVVVGHGARAVKAFLGSGDDFAAKLTYTEQADQLGPGHALYQAKDAAQDDLVMVLPGDAWYHPDLVQRLQDADGPAMIQVPDARSGRHGVPVIESDRVVDLLEQPQDSKATAFSGGAYKLPRRIFQTLEQNRFSLRDAIRQDIRDHGPWRIVKAGPQEYVDVIEVQDLLKAHDLLMPGIEEIREGTIEKGAMVQGRISIDEGSTIRAGAIVQGPVVIGKHCDIGPGAVLMPGTAIRNHVRVGPLTVLQRCSLSSNIAIGSHTRIEDAYIDNGATIGSHVHFEQSTGIIVGADAQVGDRVTLQAGATIGRQARIANGRIVHDVPDGGMAV